MKLPTLDDPEKYAGLYLFDFGDSMAVGYTAHEIEMLYESERFRHGKAYKIHRAYPDGQMELRGIAQERFDLEDGLFFYRKAASAARVDFDLLNALCARTDPPCRAKIHLAKLAGDEPTHVTALIFPAEYTDEISVWLLDGGYEGGDFVEGGASAVTGYYETTKTIVDRSQQWGTIDQTSRSRDEVYATVRKVVQR